jgi:hypothetical protein
MRIVLLNVFALYWDTNSSDRQFIDYEVLEKNYD